MKPDFCCGKNMEPSEAIMKNGYSAEGAERNPVMRKWLACGALTLALGASAQTVTLRGDVEVPSGCEGDEGKSYPVLLDVGVSGSCVAVAEAKWRDREAVLVTLAEQQCGLPAGTTWVVPGKAEGADRGRMVEQLKALRAALPASEVARRNEASKVIACIEKRIVVVAAKGSTGNQAR
jgi:hypothetical protein